MKKDAIQQLRQDVKILGKIITGLKRTTTTYDFAKKAFSIKDDYDLKKKDVFMRKWLERYRKYGIFEVKEVGNTKYYTIDMNKIAFGDATLKLKINKFEEEIPLGFVMALNVGSWIIVTIE